METKHGPEKHCLSDPAHKNENQQQIAPFKIRPGRIHDGRELYLNPSRSCRLGGVDLHLEREERK